MEIEPLKAMNEGMYLSLLMMIEVIVLITVFLAIAGFAVYLAGFAWFCFEETRWPARRQLKLAPGPLRQVTGIHHRIVPLSRSQ